MLQIDSIKNSVKLSDFVFPDLRQLFTIKASLRETSLNVRILLGMKTRILFRDHEVIVSFYKKQKFDAYEKDIFELKEMKM